MKEKLIQLFINFLPKTTIHNLRYQENPEFFSFTFFYEDEKGEKNSFELFVETNYDVRKQFISFHYPYVDVWGQKNLTSFKHQELSTKEYDNIKNMFLEHYNNQLNKFIPKI